MANNLLNKDILINYYLFKTWEDKFIPSSIIDTIVNCNFNQHKHEDYAIDHNDSNFKNNFNIAIASISIERNNINSSCV